MRKSASVVRSMGQGTVSVMRTRQASGRLIGTSAYLSKSFNTGSTSAPSSNAGTTARRRRSAVSGRALRAPRRWNASDRTASHVFQGGGKRDSWAAAQPWLPSRRLSRATRKPASTRTLPAIAGRPQIRPLPLAQVGWQPIDAADEIGDGVERRGPSAPRSTGEAQALAHDVGFRELALPPSRSAPAPPPPRPSPAHAP